MHHADYRFPLLVTWFCRPCHLKHHGAVSWVDLDRLDASERDSKLDTGLSDATTD